MAHTLQLFALYWAWLFTASMFINGVFIITRGRTEKLPDGSDKDVGKLFYFLLKPLLKTKVVAMKYCKSELELVAKKIRHDFRTSIKDCQVDIYGRLIIDPKEASRVGYDLGLTILPFDNVSFDVYKDVLVDVYPDWIKDPVLTCITCMSSIWGTMIYWLGVYFANKYGLITINTECVLAWVFFCVILSYTNTYISKRI